MFFRVVTPLIASVAGGMLQITSYHAQFTTATSPCGFNSMPRIVGRILELCFKTPLLCPLIGLKELLPWRNLF